MSISVDKEKSCCFTGHRPETLYAEGLNEQEAKMIISNAVNDAIQSGFRLFICGGCRGGDFLFGEVVAEIKKKRSDIFLECAVPCLQQSAKWNSADRERYDNLLSSADRVTVLSSHYYNGCMQNRNRYMVDNSAMLIAMFNGSSGGTAFTVKYAQKKHLTVVNLLDRQLLLPL